jgi:hypothetical protein
VSSGGDWLFRSKSFENSAEQRGRKVAAGGATRAEREKGNAFSLSLLPFFFWFFLHFVYFFQTKNNNFFCVFLFDAFMLFMN